MGRVGRACQARAKLLRWRMILSANRCPRRRIMRMDRGGADAYIPAIHVIEDDNGFARRAGGAQRRFAMATTPLMPKATAVWLGESAALSFDQIAVAFGIRGVV